MGYFSGTRLLQGPGTQTTVTNELLLTFHSDHSGDGELGYEVYCARSHLAHTWPHTTHTHTHETHRVSMRSSSSRARVSLR